MRKRAKDDNGKQNKTNAAYAVNRAADPRHVLCNQRFLLMPELVSPLESFCHEAIAV